MRAKVSGLKDLLARATETPGGCQVWTWNISTGGYGQLRYRGRMTYAHRLAYEFANEPIPPGLTVDHLCFTPACINPSHLRLLTPSENSRNQRGARPLACKRGHQMSSENTYIDPRGAHHCRACRRAANRRHKNRNMT